MMNPTTYDNNCEDDISNYECNKHLTGISVYDFYFDMKYLNGSPVSIRGHACTTGKQSVEETKKITVVRTALLNTTIVQTIVTVWK
jgi:hypothetical protein